MPVILDNPVLNGLIAGIQERRQAEQQKAEMEARKVQQQQSQQHLDAYIKNLEHEQKLAESQLDIQKSRLGMERTSHELEARKTLANMISSGQYHPGQGPMPQATLGAEVQQVQNPGGLGPVIDINNLPSRSTTVQPTLQVQPGVPSQPIQIGDLTINPDDFAKPEELQQLHETALRKQGEIEASIAGAKAKAVATAQQPFELEQLGIKKDQAMSVAQLNAERAKQVAEMNATSRLAAAQIGANARIAAAKLGVPQADTGIIQNNAILHAFGQGGNALGNTKPDLATKLALSNMGYVDLGGKDTGKLKDVHALDPLYATMEEFVSKLPESGVNAVGQKIIGKIPATDLKNFQDRVRGMSGNIAKTIGGESGRLSEDDIKRAVELLVVPGITKEQAIERLQFLQGTTRSKVVDQILGGMPEKQKLLVIQHYGFDPKQFDSGIVVNGRTIPKYRQDKDGEWLIADPKAGGYVSINASR